MKPTCFLSYVFGLLCCAAMPLPGATYYTATGGSDTNPGTLGAPFASVQHGADALMPGDTLLVRGGTYTEAVTVNASGSASGGVVTVANYPGETAVLDGAALTVPAATTGMFLIVNRHYVTVRGFEIRNYKSSTKNIVPVGIHVRGASDHIQLLNNRIHAIETNVTTATGGDAHGIAVYGDSTAQPIHDLVIDGNELYALKLGSSESLVVNGNVDGFQITNNLVHDNNNIGIDCIGFEGTASDPNLDQARNGVVRGNTVYNINSYGNPAYGTDRSADGVYVDGGTNIVIDRNTVHNCNIGVELASEHAGKVTSLITVRDNFIYQNDIGGVFIGGYDTKRGSTQNCIITSNTLYNNDTLQNGNGEFYIQYAANNNTFKQNIVWANAQNLLIGNPFTTTAGNVVDWNLYYAPAGANAAQWQWKKTTKTGFAAYKTFSGNDANSLFVGPGLSDPANGDLHLLPTSPARDAGDPAYSPAADETDIDGGPRVTGGRVDIGADELRGLVSWQVKYFGSNATNPSVAGPNANPSGDGIANLVKYALGLDPTRPGVLPATTTIANGYLTLTVNRNSDATDVSLAAESGDALAGGSGWSVGTTTVLTNTSAVFQARDNVPVGSGSQRFLRLRVNTTTGY